METPETKPPKPKRIKASDIIPERKATCPFCYNTFSFPDVKQKTRPCSHLHLVSYNEDGTLREVVFRTTLEKIVRAK